MNAGSTGLMDMQKHFAFGFAAPVVVCRNSTALFMRSSVSQFSSKKTRLTPIGQYVISYLKDVGFRLSLEQT